MSEFQDVIKKPNLEVEYSNLQIDELRKCANDPIYFIKNYVNIQHPTKGKIKFKLYDYQEKYIRAMHRSRLVISMQSRQMRKNSRICGLSAVVCVFQLR